MTKRRGQPDARPWRPAPQGFTLVEMTVSLAVLSILLIAIGSAIMLAAKTLPQQSDPSRETTSAVMTVEDMTTELQYALAFSVRSATGVEFSVAVRDGDGSRETIRFAWSGTAGDPLTREYNGALAVTVLDDVEQFELLYDTIVSSETMPTEVESSEQSLVAMLAGATKGTYTIRELEWTGQYFLPSLPPDAITWKVTRVQFWAKKIAAVDGLTLVQLRPPDANDHPTPTVLEEFPMPESSLAATMVQQEFQFTTVPSWPADQGLCLVLKWAAGKDAAGIDYSQVDGTGRLSTLDGGATWSRKNASSLLYAVFGTYTQPGTMNVNRTYLTGVRIKLRAGAETATLVQTSTPLLHVKEITP